MKKSFLTVPFLDKSPSEDPHEPCQTHQLHPEFLQHPVDGGVKLGSAAVQLVVHHLVPVKHSHLTKRITLIKPTESL